MSYIRYKKNNLFVENVSVRRLASKFSTPFYLYSESNIIENYKSFSNNFQEVQCDCAPEALANRAASRYSTRIKSIKNVAKINFGGWVHARCCCSCPFNSRDFRCCCCRRRGRCRPSQTRCFSFATRATPCRLAEV